MSKEDLFNVLEEKVQSAIEVIQLLKMEISDLKSQNEELIVEKQQWEEKISTLIAEFEKMEQEESNNSEQTQIDHSADSANDDKIADESEEAEDEEYDYYE